VGLSTGVAVSIGSTTTVSVGAGVSVGNGAAVGVSVGTAGTTLASVGDGGGVNVGFGANVKVGFGTVARTTLAESSDCTQPATSSARVTRLRFIQDLQDKVSTPICMKSNPTLGKWPSVKQADRAPMTWSVKRKT
jgi:hypothetical protein